MALAHEGSIVFVITKPLQLIVSLAILAGTRSARRTELYVIDSFAGAREICDRLLRINGGAKISFFLSHAEAYKAVEVGGFDEIFIDSDVGWKNFYRLRRLKCSFKKTKINVYEEGVGSYRDDLYSPLRQTIFGLLGVAWHFGGCRYTDNIYLFESDRYVKKFPKAREKSVQISESFISFLRANLDELKFIFNGGRVADKCIGHSFDECTVYLTDWKLREAGISYLYSSHGLKIIKPHPHIKDIPVPADCLVADAWIPAEILLFELLERFKKITVLHHGSSSAHYLHAERIQFVQIPIF